MIDAGNMACPCPSSLKTLPPHKSGDTNRFCAPLDFQGGKGGLISIIRNLKTCLQKYDPLMSFGRTGPFHAARVKFFEEER